MTRKKVSIAYIVNELQRKATYRKRMKGLLNKIHELTTLCGVDTCAIIYSPYDREPIVWPSRVEAQAVLERFRKVPDVVRVQKMVNQELLMRQRIQKAKNQLIRVRRENKLKDLKLFMIRCIFGKESMKELDPHDVGDMRVLLTEFCDMLDARMNESKQAEKHDKPNAPASNIN